MHTLNVLSIFLLGTSLGCLIMLFFIPYKEIGPRFYRFFGFLAGAFTLLYGFFNYTEISPVWVGTILILALYCWWTTLRPRLGVGVFLPASLFALGVTYWQVIAPLHPSLAKGLFDFTLFQSNFFLSALLLGATLTSMILGHWYLVEPKLAIKPFMTLTWVFITALVLRFMGILGGLFYYWQVLPRFQREPLEKLLSVEGELVFLIQRILFGILLPLLLSYFIWNTVKIRSTQSATGILYVTVVFIFIGELIGIHLSLRTGFLM